ncbi:MAG: hypothetical protein MJ252_28425 [archaeon]|nr:hypothetical protein [archaeon]
MSLLNDTSEKDTDAYKKKMALELKEIIKKSSHDYLENIKEETIKRFKGYFEELNNAIAHENESQEAQQKDIQTKLEEKGARIANIKERIIARKKIQLKEKEFKTDLLMKLKIFSMLKHNAQEEKAIRKKGAMIAIILQKNKLQKIFQAFKKESFFLSTDKYIQKMKEASKNKFNDFSKNQSNQKEEMLKLIAQAKERLKHENRKKIQVKLLLDQMILRGISSLNMQAISLSQNSLKGKINKIIFRCC